MTIVQRAAAGLAWLISLVALRFRYSTPVPPVPCRMAATDPTQPISSDAMLNKYKKKEAPSWQRKLVLVLGSLFGATLLLFVVWAVVLFIEWAEVDDCLDKGGSYDYERGECDFQSNHAAPRD